MKLFQNSNLDLRESEINHLHQIMHNLSLMSGLTNRPCIFDNLIIK